MSDIKKKFVDSDQIDGLKLLFLNAQFLRFRNAANLANIDWTKFDSDNIAKILSKTFYNQTVLGTDPKELVNVEYLTTKFNEYYQDTNTAFATTSATPIPITGFNFTPAAGTYILSASMQASFNNAKPTGIFGVYLNGVLVANSERSITSPASGKFFEASLLTRFTTPGSQIVDIRVQTSSNTITIRNRSLNLRLV